MTSSPLHDIANIIFPDTLQTPDEVRAAYPSRKLAEGARVTRFAPSPTGFLHIGGLFTSLASERMAHQSGGIFYLRIEDTDQKREVDGTVELILSSFAHFGIEYDEGPTLDGKSKGEYGPYFQSQRNPLYHTFIKQLLLEDKAYVCFATPDELQAITEKQMSMKLQPGYHGEWAIWRHRTPEQVLEELHKGRQDYVIRIKSPGTPGKRMIIEDVIRGKIDMPENINDIVIMKGDEQRLPTYHFAHVVDDSLMGTTHVTRGDEWIASVPTHIQLFQLLGWKPPKYAHIAPIQKLDTENGHKRKLSKRKDPESSVEYYMEHGYTPEAMKEYLINIANSNFEDWRRANKNTTVEEFPLSFKKFNNSGGLLDMTKLDNISKNYIATLSNEEIYQDALSWAEEYNADLATRMKEHKPYILSILNIERTGKDVRKDIAKWSDIEDHIAFFFTETLDRSQAKELLSNMSTEDVLQAVTSFKEQYTQSLDKDTWLDTIKNIAVSLGYASSTKEFKQAEPGTFKGHFGAIAQALRVAITGRSQTPDLYEIMQVLGEEESLKRLETFSL